MSKLTTGVVAQIPLDQLNPDPLQPRKTFDKDSLAALGESIKVRVEHPLKVRLDGKKLVIVDGERRWRAAKLMKLKTLPCLLHEGAEQIEIATAQIATATQREALAALDIGEFLIDLQKRQKRSRNELLGELAKRGIKGVGPGKLEDYIALTELPEWAKVLMRSGAIRETSGLAILQAVKFPKVLEEIRRDLVRDANFRGELVLSEVKETVEQAFRRIGTDLNNKNGSQDDKRLFPIEQCRACEFYKKHAGVEYCLNRALFDKKNKEALALKEEKQAKRQAAEKKKAEAAPDPTDPTLHEPRKLPTSSVSGEVIVKLGRLSYQDRRNLSDAKFDTGDCEACPHRRKASHDGTATHAEPHCFHPPCFEEKSRLAGRQAGKRERMRDYLEAWLRPIVRKLTPDAIDERQIKGLMLWLATGAVDQGSSYYHGQMHEKAARCTQAALDVFALRSIGDVMEFAGKITEQEYRKICVLAVDAMTRDQVRWFAINELKLSLDTVPETPYRVDEAYWKFKRKSELQDAVRLVHPDLETVAGMGVGELRDILLKPEAREKIGVPADIEALYREEFKKRDVDEDVEDDLLDDDDVDDELAGAAGAIAGEGGDA